MGFQKQPNDFTCGPFALKHALMALGKFSNETTISKLAKTHWKRGTDADGIALAARKYGCKVNAVFRKDPNRAKRELIDNLRRNIPVIIAVKKSEHWATAVGYDKKQFIVVDSGGNPCKHVIGIYSWSKLRKYWVYHQRDDEDRDMKVEVYEMQQVIPKFKAKTKAMFTVKQAQYLRRKSSKDLMKNWDEYYSSLLEMCQPKTSNIVWYISMAELLRRHGEMIREEVGYWHGNIKETDLKQILFNLRFVAEVYGLIVPRAQEKRVIIGLTTLLALWSSERKKIPSILGTKRK